jgi:hypothetical protein
MHYTEEYKTAVHEAMLWLAHGGMVKLIRRRFVPTPAAMQVNFVDGEL